MDKDLLFIIPEESCKPIKIFCENKTSSKSKVETRLPNEKEVRQMIKSVLFSMKYDIPLTTVQYRSEKGKIKYYKQEVYNFIKKRDSKAYGRLMEWMDTEEDHFEITITKQVPVCNFIGDKIGIYRV